MTANKSVQPWALCFALIALVLAAFASFAADRVLEPGWSNVVVKVIDDDTRRPVVGAQIATTCRGSRYEAERHTTDASGQATVPIYRSWVALKVTREGYTNSSVSILSTNSVSEFCTNAVIILRKVSK